MMLQPIRIPRVQSSSPIVDGSGRSTAAFLQTINSVLAQVEGAINGIIDAQNSAEAAAAAAQAANEAAIAAIAQASTAQSSADTAQIAADGATSDAATALAVANSKLSQSTADLRYVRQSLTPTWITPTGTLARSLSQYASPGASATYSQSQIDDLMAATQSLSRVAAALMTDLRANKALS